MPRLALINLLIGFVALTLSAAGGAFIANELTDAFIYDRELLDTWSQTIQNSAHGHFNLFGFLHIVFGLTMPYSKLSPKIKTLQTLGLAAGTLAMGPGMVARSFVIPSSEGIDFIGFAIGGLLSAALATLVLHCYGLAVKLQRT